jgi:hypothetical protein
MTKKHLSCVAYIALGVMGLVLIAVTVSNAGVFPRSQACGNQPCQPNGSWTVNYSGCMGLCSCSGNSALDTCYYESGTCNNDPNNRPATFTACYRGGCCCPSGNCAGQPTGGGGGRGGNLENFDNSEPCYDDFECDFGYFCDWSSNTCSEQ